MVLSLHKISRIAVMHFFGIISPLSATRHFGWKSFTFSDSEEWPFDDARSFIIPGQSMSTTTGQQAVVSQSKQ